MLTFNSLLFGTDHLVSRPLEVNMHLRAGDQKKVRKTDVPEVEKDIPSMFFFL